LFARVGWSGVWMVEFRLLGPVEVRTGDRGLEMGPRQQRAVLAALAVDAGHPVPLDTLVDRVWDEAPPPGARAALYSHITRIRRALESVEVTGEQPVRLVRRAGGYVLDVDPDRVDLHQFRRLSAAAREPRCSDTDRAGLLGGALGLWRGTPLADLPGQWAERMREGWRQQQLDAAVAWARAELALGRPEVVIGPVRDLLAAYPLVEPLVGTLMRALAAAGRDSEALDCYATTRSRLVDELGVEPGPELQAVHRAILRGELAAAAGGAAVGPIPAQLPPDVHGFTGRDDELRELDGLLVAAGDEPSAVVISAVSGTAGVGKTALAVHWAHRIQDRFPDGQLYVNLRGFDPTGSAMAPAEAIRGFLDAFAVPPQRIPLSLEAQAGLYRSLLASRRVLILLDNARNADQVRPLLPGSPGCMVVVTSRNQLPGLVVTEGARPIDLDLMSAGEARDLLSRRLGADRVAAEPEPVHDIINLCVRLPLALAIVAARAATHPGFSLAVLAKELREAHGGLDAFDGDDAITDIRAVFSWSYQTLRSESARVFRLLGLHPGPDVAAPAVASLAGLSLRQARAALAVLARAHLVNEQSPGRFAFHDLLRAYAAELAHDHDPKPDQRRAALREFDHYLHTSHRAALLLNPHRDPIVLPPAQPGVVPADVSDYPRALAWFTAEHPVLIAAVDEAARIGFDTHAWQLAWTLEFFFDRRERWHDWAATQAVALAAARRLADRPAQALAHSGLARAYIRLARSDDAHSHLLLALDLLDELGDRTGQAHAHRDVAWLHEGQGRNQEALRHAQQALDLFQSVEHRTGQARALNAVGWFHAKLGHHQEALRYCQQAVDLQRDIGDHFGQAETWDSLGYAHHRLGQQAEGAACYQHALDLYRAFDDRYNEADTLVALGDIYRATGDSDSARAVWQQAFTILHQLAHPQAHQVRAKLDELAGA
jgi:DNA-binding SARP family transcriptional activator/tetratricopeptide (TPR) repeat protein